MIIGYARVSTDGQDLALQTDALRLAGAEKIFSDVISGSTRLEARPGWLEARRAAGAGDVITVWRLDRIGRSLRALVDAIEELRGAGIGIRSISDGAIDTTTSSGALIFHVFAALAEFERSLILERTRAGLTAARARGRRGGRPRNKYDCPRAAGIARMYAAGMPAAEIAAAVGISKPTVYRTLKGRKTI